MEDYIPKVISNKPTYIQMVVEGNVCGICDKTMLPRFGYGVIFPKWLKIDQDAQMRSAGFVYTSNVLVDDHPICEECEAAGKADFLCALCNQRKSSDKKQEQFGDPAEFLCFDCYNTVPAAVWHKKCDELIKEHQYDCY